jgi:hypothetical protein
MDTAHIYDLSEVIDMLETIIDEQEPGATHTQCMYFKNGAPVCLVGEVLNEVGITSADLKVGDDLIRNGNLSNFTSLCAKNAKVGALFTVEAQVFLRAVQSDLDYFAPTKTHRSWREAFDDQLEKWGLDG